MTQPARIAVVIDNVNSHLARWSDVAQESLFESQAALNQYAEYADRAEHEAGIHVHHAKDNGRTVDDARSTCEAAGNTVDELLESVADRRTALTRALAFAKDCLAAWTGELAEARDWLGRARDRLSAAVKWVEKAEATNRRAERAFQKADAALEACLGGPGRRAAQKQSRRRCRREWQQFDTALTSKKRASEELHRSRLEKLAAEEQVTAAEARVLCCEEAVDAAGASVTAGQEGIRLVDDAEYHANLARDFQTAAATAVAAAASAVEAQRAEADRSLSEAGRAVDAVGEADRELRIADTSYQSGRRYARDAQRDLEGRTERLRDYDRPGM